jgi:hypothetical protein
MGGSSSKPAPVAETAKTFTPDLSKFTVTGDYAVELQRKAEEAAAATSKAMEEGQAALAAQMAAASSASWWTNVKWGAALLATIVVMAGIGYLIWYILFKTGVTNKDPGSGSSYGTTSTARALTVYSATHGTNNVTPAVQALIANTDSLSLATPLSTTLMAQDPTLKLNATDTFSISYASSGILYNYNNVSDSTAVIISPVQTPGTAAGSSGATPPTDKSTAPPSQPGFFARLWGSVSGGSSGDLLGSIHDATTTTSVSGSNAPLSSEGDGAYGMQWWMFVKDWNYGYGKDKSVVVRPDPTNSKVMNPSISLHPTDNSLRVSVSVFPSTEGGAAASQPAPAGHSGASDDVFVCEVPNIPLQTWFSVSVTVFGRNLDIYIDGKLVKSCFLTGVPKPATGDVQVTPGGGFSGNICNFTHYPRMLTPSDANSFWTAGTSCQKATAPSSTAAATGYSVKFGVYDPLGKQVQQYTF